MFSKRLLFAFVFAAAGALHAAGVGGGLPWETPLSNVATSLTGPTAAAIGLIGVVLAGATLVFVQHDLGHFGRTMAHVGLAGGTMLLAGRFLTSVFGVGGAVI